MSEQEKEQMEAVKPTVVTIPLSKPVTWEDENYSELRLDYEGLSGDDIINLESDFMDFIAGKRNVFVAFKDEHPAYLAVLSARAAGVHPNFMKKLGAKDFLKVTGAAKNFLHVTA
ncbi:hypothetical protein ABIC86_002493 [Paenibacillus sp. DS2363]|uniref:hypothetical protein n=1 Tax=Paenibacillus sp. DS2363 TaxID=3156427 RepID=UPI003394C354